MRDEHKHIGQTLHARRLALGLTVSDIAATTHLREDYILAIERMDQEALPAIGYVLGFVRSYAKGLGLDPNQAVAQYKKDAALAESMALHGSPHFVFRRQIRLPRGFAPAISVLAAVALLGTWYGLNTAAVAEPTTSPIILPLDDIETPVSPIMEEGMITLRMRAPSWIEITDSDGTPIISRIFVSGETWQGPSSEGYMVSVRDAGAVELFDGTRLIGPLGAKGEPLSQVVIQADN